jgi:hypothetical protein
MNDGLVRYEHEERVISIHGYIYPVKDVLPETFFIRGADCWGWATWKRGWDLFEADGKKLQEQIKVHKIKKSFNYDGVYDLTGMLASQVKGKVDSWAIRWYASAVLADKLTLYPGKSLIVNIGNDSSGTHCGTTEVFSGDVAESPITVGSIAIQENTEARAVVVKYFISIRKTFLQKIVKVLIKSINLMNRR